MRMLFYKYFQDWTSLASSQTSASSKTFVSVLISLLLLFSFLLLLFIIFIPFQLSLLFTFCSSSLSSSFFYPFYISLTSSSIFHFCCPWLSSNLSAKSGMNFLYLHGRWRLLFLKLLVAIIRSRGHHLMETWLNLYASPLSCQACLHVSES